MKYKGELLEFNHCIEYDATEDFKPCFEKIQELINDNKGLKIIKNGQIFDYIMNSYDLDNNSCNQASVTNFLFKKLSVSADGRYINTDTENNLDIFILYLYINDYLLSKMIEKNKINKIIVSNILEESYFLNHKDFSGSDYTKTLIKHGMERYIERDYISALFILLPQIEHILRNICKINDIKHTYSYGESQELEFVKSVEKIIKLLITEDIEMNSNFKRFLFMFLFNDTKYISSGLNYRNDICHGIPTNLNPTISSNVIVILLYFLLV